jgi:hypothetical protein
MNKISDNYDCCNDVVVVDVDDDDEVDEDGDDDVAINFFVAVASAESPYGY